MEIKVKVLNFNSESSMEQHLRKKKDILSFNRTGHQIYTLIKGVLSFL